MTLCCWTSGDWERGKRSRVQGELGEVSGDHAVQPVPGLDLLLVVASKCGGRARESRVEGEEIVDGLLRRELRHGGGQVCKGTQTA